MTCATDSRTTTLVGWYRQGVDVETALPALSTYMGHLRPKDTYWYLEEFPNSSRPPPESSSSSSRTGD